MFEVKMKPMRLSVLIISILLLSACRAPTPTPQTEATPTENPATPTPQETVTTQDLSSNLQVYLDDEYTIVWDDTNMPDLSDIQWSPDTEQDSPYQWQVANLIAYLKNIGTVEIKVYADSSPKPGYAVPGFSASSNTVILKPGECSPITITIRESPEVLSFSSSSGNVIYFHVLPTN